MNIKLIIYLLLAVAVLAFAAFYSWEAKEKNSETLSISSVVFAK